jgi:hypothetical protein
MRHLRAHGSPPGFGRHSAVPNHHQGVGILAGALELVDKFEDGIGGDPNRFRCRPFQGLGHVYSPAAVE